MKTASICNEFEKSLPFLESNKVDECLKEQRSRSIDRECPKDRFGVSINCFP